MGAPVGAVAARAELIAALPVVERTLDINGIRTPVLEGGGGTPVVLLHGIGSFCLEWSLVIPRLVSQYRVVAPDLPGTGGSAVADRRLDAATLTQWLAGLIDRTCDEKPIIVGHSAGGGLALRLALGHRDRIRQLLLVDASSLGLFRPAPGLILALLRFGSRPSPASRDRFLKQVLAHPDRAMAAWGNRWPALESYDLAQAANKQVGAANGQLLRNVGIRHIRDETLRSIDVPVSLVWGTLDRLMPFRIAEKASSKFGWPLWAIEECGHGPQIENPEMLGDALEEILCT